MSIVSRRFASAFSAAFFAVAFGAAIGFAAETIEVANLPAVPKPRGKASTEVFGMAAKANRVVYILDQSSSMAQHSANALRAGAKEIVESLGHLSKHQQFGIVVYNERVTKFPDIVGDERMLEASSEHRQDAVEFLAGVKAKGNAFHAEAILAAYSMKPDVVFLITDSEAKFDVSSLDLVRLRGVAAKTPCMVIQLGNSKTQRCQNLARLAGESGGRYETMTYDGAWGLAFPPKEREADRSRELVDSSSLGQLGR